MSRNVAELHADWLRLVEPEGQFLSLPVLRRAFSSGLEAVPRSVRALLSEHFPRAQRGATPDEHQWDAWFEWLLRDVLAWGAAYRTGDDAAIYSHAVPERAIVLRADGALVDPETEKARVLIVRYPHGTPLDRRLTGGRWNASPLDRLTLLCRAYAVRIGLLTDGERILLAWIPNQGPGGHAIWETDLFTESRERNLLQSFISLLHASRFFAVREGDQVESLFEESARAESDVTDRLGFQVRQAVELLIAALSRADLDSNGALLAGIAPQRVYEAAATVMMRLVFLLFAEERDLLPMDDPFYTDSYAASTLREQLDEQAAVEGDEPLERRSTAWFRLLALFRAVYAGLEHDRLRIPPYAGRLFDPDRFPFLEGRTADEGWSDAASRPLPIDDLTVRAILEALQTLPIRDVGSRERRRLSFRALDVEQIGHVYEGLLDHGVVRVDDVYVGLVGKSGDEAEIPLTALEQKAREGEQPLVSFLHDFTGKSEGAVAQLIERGRAIALGRDPDARRLINTTCDNDATLAGRVSPFFHTLRRDLHDLPVVFPPQSLVVKQTSQRRSTGTEYTPRDLAEEMVRYALEPIVYSPGPREGVERKEWRLRPSSELLDLKICDPAVGSGAFLVSACRYLADLVVEAWIAEDPARAQDDREDLTLEARRAVVDRCLYGVDRDAMAVEMAKLSLWLVTMARERPFSFLDHAIRCGDSLLGITSLDQLRYLHIDPHRGKEVHARTLVDALQEVQLAVEHASKIRSRLEALPCITARNADEKQRLNQEADSLLDTVRVVADGVISTALSSAGRGDNNRTAAFQGLAVLVSACVNPAHSNNKKADAIETLRLRNGNFLNAGRPDGGLPRETLHWPLAFPEVFARQQSGFDLVIGNPPFLGDQRLRGALGSDYREYLGTDIAEGHRGRADLVAYFFLRAASLSTRCALVGTSSIAQGQTRTVGLDSLLAKQWLIERAVRKRPWPGSAAVQVSQIWLSRSGLAQPFLDGNPVKAINSGLEAPSRVMGLPHRLAANEELCFKGSYVGGMGFVLTTEQGQQLLRDDPRNEEIVFPYLIGDDVCSDPQCAPSRWIINFFERSETAARQFGMAWQIVENKVRPERQRTKSDGSYVLRTPLPQRWWQHADKRPGLYRAIRGLPRLIVVSLTSKSIMPVMIDSGSVYDQSLVVFASGDYGLLGLLCSNVHRSWAFKYAVPMGGHTPRYTPSNCFHNFPLPLDLRPLNSVGTRLEEYRRNLMLERGLGLTSLYNLVDKEEEIDQSIVELRRLHCYLDNLVVAAYGWGDLRLQHGFFQTEVGTRYTLDSASRLEILDRLLELNHNQRAAEVGDDDVSNANNDGARRFPTTTLLQDKTLFAHSDDNR